MSRFSIDEIAGILGEVGPGTTVTTVCRRHRISTATFYQWKSKYAGLPLPDMARLYALETENDRLKRMYAELALEVAAMKEASPRRDGERATESAGEKG
jgi:putative transposase